jgi:hypothetical protein
MRQAVHPALRRVLYLALAIALSVAASATAAPITTVADVSDQRKALYQSELEQNLLLRTQLGYSLIAALGPLQPGSQAGWSPRSQRWQRCWRQ